MTNTLRNITVLLVACAAVACAGAIALAQGRGGAPWSTIGNDAQRTSWVRSDPRITKEALQKGAFEFLWSSKLENAARQPESLTQPVLLPNIISYKGFKALAFIGGSAGNVYAIDYDLNRLFWKRHLDTASATAGTTACPGGLTTITRQTPLVPPNPSPTRGSFLGAGGRLNPPSPGVGGRGAPANPNALPAGQRGRGAAPGGPRNVDNGVYVVAGDGMLHTLNPQTGEDTEPVRKLVNANANLSGLILIDDTAFVAATGNCRGVADGVYAIDVRERNSAVRSWDAKGASIAGTTGPAFAPDGTIYVTTGEGGAAVANSIVALDSKTLAQKGVFTAPSPFVTAPVVLSVKGKELVAAATRDGKVCLLDSASLATKTPLATVQVATGADFAPGALAAWVESDGTGWIIVPLSGSIIALKVGEQNGVPALQQGWASRDMTSPLTPAVLNGIVFAVSGGGSHPAVLYALDATTGKELWNSGTTMKAPAHGAGPSAGDSQVYVTTADGTIYAFGIPLEH